MSRRRATRVLITLLLVVVAATGARASGFLDPRLHFRTIETEHFLIYFHAGEDRQAARLAVIAEEVWPKVGRALGITAPRRTHVMLVDQSEAANGWATPLPYNTVYITAAAPAGYEYLGNDSDWLRLVFTHEFTHIVHLDRSGGWARLFRGAFGRTPIAFPNLWLPRWQIEGLAVWEESQVTGEGRLFAGDFRAIEWLQDPVLPLDRVNGGLTRWPGGLAPYVNGSGFHSYLAERLGDESLAALAGETARRLPFLGAPAFKKVYGQSLGTLWRDYAVWLERLRSQPRGQARIEPHQVTHLGDSISAPRFLPPACDGCPLEIAFTRRGPDEFPALYSVPATAADREPSPPPRRLATRYLGTTIGVDRNVVVFDQQEIRRNSGLYSDLIVLERSSGRTRTLVREGRLQEPDLSPDGRSIAAVRESDDGRELVIVTLSESLRHTGGFAGARVLSTSKIDAPEGTLFNTPRWSPDGSLLVAARQRPGTMSELALVDPVTGTVRDLLGLPATRIVTPTWTPDGRFVVAALALLTDTFDLYLFDTIGSEVPRRLTFTRGGALWPDVSSDGQQLTFAGQTATGFDLFLMPFDPAQADEQPFQPSPADPATSIPALPPSRGYDPWATLLPRSWFPLLEIDDSQTRLGASVAGNDVLRRHLYAVSATWLVAHPDGASTPGAATPDWTAAYVYDRWRPTLFISGSSETLFAAGPPTPSGRPTNLTVRERELQAGVMLAAQHVRATHRALLSAVGATDRVVGPGRFVNGERVAFRLGGSTTTAHSFANSISPERGIAAGATVELVREALGASADATTVTGDLRAYLPAFGQHDVVALRAGGGTTSGPLGVRRTFVMGGLDNVGDVINFSRDAFGLLRGFPVNTFAGSHVALLNADYRLPLARPERGFGTWPIFLRSIHATLFADAGHAWSDSFASRDIKTSLGGELVFDLIAGYSLPVSVALGAAVGHDGSTSNEHSMVYGRFSRTF